MEVGAIEKTIKDGSWQNYEGFIRGAYIDKLGIWRTLQAGFCFPVITPGMESGHLCEPFGVGKHILDDCGLRNEEKYR